MVWLVIRFFLLNTERYVPHITSYLQQPENCTETHLIFLKALGIHKYFRAITLIVTGLTKPKEPHANMCRKMSISRAKGIFS